MRRCRRSRVDPARRRRRRALVPSCSASPTLGDVTLPSSLAQEKIASPLSLSPFRALPKQSQQLGWGKGRKVIALLAPRLPGAALLSSRIVRGEAFSPFLSFALLPSTALRGAKRRSPSLLPPSGAEHPSVAPCSPDRGCCAYTHTRWRAHGSRRRRLPSGILNFLCCWRRRRRRCCCCCRRRHRCCWPLRKKPSSSSLSPARGSAQGKLREGKKTRQHEGPPSLPSSSSPLLASSSPLPACVRSRSKPKNEKVSSSRQTHARFCLGGNRPGQISEGATTPLSGWSPSAARGSRRRRRSTALTDDNTIIANSGVVTASYSYSSCNN